MSILEKRSNMIKNGRHVIQSWYLARISRSEMRMITTCPRTKSPHESQLFMVQELGSMVAMRLRNQQIHEISRFIRYTQNLDNFIILILSSQNRHAKNPSGHLQGIGEAERTFRDINRRLCLGHHEFHCTCYVHTYIHYML